MNSELIALIANVALTLSFIIALVFGLAQVKTVNRDRKERFTLEALHNFQTREFAELISYITTQKLPASMEEFRNLPDNDRIIFIQFSQMMENLGMLVAEGLVDID